MTRSGGASCGATRTLGAWPGPAPSPPAGDSEDRPLMMACAYIHAQVYQGQARPPWGLCQARSPTLSLPCPPRGNLQVQVTARSTLHTYPECIIRFSVWAPYLKLIPGIGKSRRKAVAVDSTAPARGVQCREYRALSYLDSKIPAAAALAPLSSSPCNFQVSTQSQYQF